jgi:hypothetical protein
LSKPEVIVWKLRTGWAVVVIERKIRPARKHKQGNGYSFFMAIIYKSGTNSMPENHRPG